MKFFSRLFSEKDQGNADDGTASEVEQGEAVSAAPPPPPPPVIAACDSRPIAIDDVGSPRTTTAPTSGPPASRVERGEARPAMARPPVAVAPARTSAGATTVTMPPRSPAEPKRVEAERPLFSPPGPAKPVGTPIAPRKPVAAATTVTAAKPLVATPIAPAPRRRKTRPSIERTDDIDCEIDAAIDGAQQADEAPAVEGKLQNDAKTEAEVRALFGRIAAQHVAHVRDFVIELGLAPTSKAWLAICRPAVVSLRRAADRIRFVALVAATDAFSVALDEAERAVGASVDGQPRADVLARYADLVKLLPEAFETKTAQSRREPTVVHALLAKVPGLGSLAIHRLYSAGVMSLAALYRARVDELVATTGIDATMCAAIIAEFQRYRRERAEQAPEADHARERRRLRTILESLGECDARFKAAEAAEDRAEKRSARRQRAVLARELDLVLAQIGELDLVHEVSRASTERRIRRIDGWLREPTARQPTTHAPA
jgi:hypothetical protein